MIYILYVVILIKKIKNFVNLVKILLICKLYICLRNHCNLCISHR